MLCGKGRDGCILLRYLRSKICSRIQGIRRENPKNPRNPGAESEESRESRERIRGIRAQNPKNPERESEESGRESKESTENLKNPGSRVQRSHLHIFVSNTAGVWHRYHLALIHHCTTSPECSILLCSQTTLVFEEHFVSMLFHLLSELIVTTILS